MLAAGLPAASCSARLLVLGWVKLKRTVALLGLDKGVLSVRRTLSPTMSSALRLAGEPLTETAKSTSSGLALASSSSE